MLSNLKKIMMKAEKKILAIVLIMAISIPCFGGIPLVKKGRGNWTKSIELVTSINAEYNEDRNALTICFDENFGNVIISIEDASGNMIYNNAVQASSGTKVFVPLQGLPAGDYRLSITLKNGDIIEGFFSVYYSRYKQFSKIGGNTILIAGLPAYSFLPKKPSIKVDIIDDIQLRLF